MATDATPKARPEARYTVQQNTLITEDLKRAIKEDAARESAKLGRRVSEATIARRYMEAGRAITDAAERAAS